MNLFSPFSHSKNVSHTLSAERTNFKMAAADNIEALKSSQLLPPHIYDKNKRYLDNFSRHLENFWCHAFPLLKYAIINFNSSAKQSHKYVVNERKCSSSEEFVNHLKTVPSEIRIALILKDCVEIPLLYEYLLIILNYFSVV